jgi:hypothetical protein
MKLAIQESIFDIKLLVDKTVPSDDGQVTAPAIETYYWGKRLLVILSLNLGKSLYL